MHIPIPPPPITMKNVHLIVDLFAMSEEWRSHPDSLELERSQKTGIACEDLQPCESHGAGASGASSDDQETSEDEDDTKAALVSSNPFALLGDEWEKSLGMYRQWDMEWYLL